MKNILVIGAAGQIGSELVPALRKLGFMTVAGFSRTPLTPELAAGGPSERIDILDGTGLVDVIRRHRIDTVEGDSYYVGYQLITNDDNDPLVINWAVSR